MLKKVFVLIGLLVFSFQLFGEETDNEEEESSDTDVIVVTGNKFEQNIEDTPEKVEVITAEEIERSGAKNLAEAIEDIPGVIVSGHPTDTIMIQGFDGDYVKFMIDGIEVTGDIGGAVAVYQIPMGNVERIEIIRGATSALYGSDAIGGVVNIITKKNKSETNDFSFALAQEFGTNLSSYSQGDFSYSSEACSLSLLGSFDYDAGKSVKKNTALAGIISEYTVPYNRLGSLRTSATFYGDKGEIGVFGAYSDSLMKVNTSTYETMDYDMFNINTGITGLINVGDLASINGFLSGKLYHLETLFKSLSDDTETPTGSIFADVEGEFRASYEPGISHALLMGGNVKLETIVGDSFDGRRMALISSVFAQDTWNIGARDIFFLVPGLRFDFSPSLDENDSFLYQLTPKLSLRFDPTEKTILRASYGMGYKIPSLKHKYWLFVHPYAPGTGNFILYGNPDLKPERSQGFNVSIEQDFREAFTFSASGYFNFVRNLIDSQITGYDSGESRYERTYRNVGKALTYGGDASFRYGWKRGSVMISYAYTGAKEYSDDYGKYVDLGSRVPHQIAITAIYMIPVIETEVSFRGSWDAPQLVDYGEESYSPDLLMVSMTASKKFFDEKLEVYLRGENLLNNLHFFTSDIYGTQEEYFGLGDGIVLNIGGRLKW